MLNTAEMAYLAKLYRPERFVDSDRFALNPISGDLLPWKWSSLNPTDFCIDHNNNLWHDCDDKKTYSRVVRNGLLANNFFQEDPPSPPIIKYSEHHMVKVGKRKKHKPSVSTSGNWHSRKKKYKKQKYKNSKKRSRKYPDKRHRGKMVKSGRVAAAKDRAIVPVKDVCQYCLIGENMSNIFYNPKEKYSCDFCAKCYDGIQLSGPVCEGCLYLCYRSNFCTECKNNLGEWKADWRMKLNIPQVSHPHRCGCQECFQWRSLRPCWHCGMLDHAASCCPWGVHNDRYNDVDYLDFDYDDFEQQVRDDYLFGWG